MSGVGQTRSYGGVGLMSGLPSEAAVERTSMDGREVPQPAVSNRSRAASLFDHLVGAGE
jgi:hypothetical protein